MKKTPSSVSVCEKAETSSVSVDYLGRSRHLASHAGV